MKSIILTVVCFAVLAKCYRVGFRRPGRHFRDDEGSELGSDIRKGLDMDASAVATAEAVANGVGTARATAEAVARGTGPANAVARAVTNSRTGLLEPRSQSAASGYQRGASSGANQYDAGSSGAESQGFYNSGQQNFHNRGHHHSSITKIEHAETSDEHDVGGSESFEESANRLSAFNKHGSGASRFGNNFERAAQRADSYL